MRVASVKFFLFFLFFIVFRMIYWSLSLYIGINNRMNAMKENFLKGV